MSLAIRFTARAETDIDRLVGWLAEHSPAASKRASEAIYDTIDQLADFPESAPISRGRRRDLMVCFGRDGFMVRYRIDRDGIAILRVFHGRQQR